MLSPGKILRSVSLAAIFCVLLPPGGKAQVSPDSLGVPRQRVHLPELLPIRQHPAILVRHEDYTKLKSNFEALPATAQGRRNKIVRAWFSENEADRQKATQEFISYWKNYAKRWTPEKLDTPRPDGVSLRGIWRTVQLYDLVASYGYLTEDDRTEFRDALVAAVELALGDDPDNIRVIGWENVGWRLSNIWTDVALAPGTVALAFPELPQADKWVRFSVDELLWSLEQGTWDGAWHECPRYHLYMMKITSNFLISLYNRTGVNLFGHPSVKALARWCVDFSTPRDIVAGQAAGMPGGVVLSPGLGDSTWGENMTVLNIFASYLQDTDPELSGELMWLWNRSGYHSSEEPVPDLLVDRNLPSAGKVELRSTINARKGFIVMRDRHDTPDEVWFLLKCGDVSLCGHENGDTNSFSLNAFGTPLALDAGSGDYDDPNQRAWNKRTVSHNVVAFRNPGEDDPAKYPSSAWEDGTVLNWQTNEYIDYSATDASGPNRVERYIRHVVFVKPSYFVIRDEIVSGYKETSYLLHSPAEAIEREGSLFRFLTPWNTSLDLHVVAPAAELQYTEREGQIGAWTKTNPDTRSWYKFKTQKYVDIQGRPDEDFITILHPRKEGIEQLEYTLAQDGTIEVRTDDRTDRILFTGDGVEITKGERTFSYKNTYEL